jgi:hypothetical protein
MSITVTSARPTAPVYRESSAGRKPRTYQATLAFLQELPGSKVSTMVRLNLQSREKGPSIRRLSLPQGARISTARPDVPRRLDPNQGLSDPFSATSRRNLVEIGRRFGQADIFQEGGAFGFVDQLRNFGSGVRSDFQNFLGISPPPASASPSLEGSTTRRSFGSIFNP